MKVKHLLIFLVVLFIAGCATVDYQSYEGAKPMEGAGGTKVVVNGIDFWANGSPPRRFIVIGVATSEIGSGFGDESMIRSAVSDEVIKQGGNAAIQMNNNTSFNGMFSPNRQIYMASGVKRMQFSIIKYLP
jgi:hypothetical protein